MADPVTLLGAVGAAPPLERLVELSARIISRLHEYTAITNDVPTRFRSLSAQLNLLGVTLQQVINQSAADGDTGGVVSAAVELVLENVLADVVFLEKRIIPPSGSTFDRGIQALRSVARDDQVQEKIQRIQANIQLLGFHQNTRQISMGKTILDKVNSSTFVSPPTSPPNREGEANLAELRNLVARMDDSVKSAKRLGNATLSTQQRAPLTISAWLLKMTNWIDHPIVSFLLTDWDSDGVLDLMALKKQTCDSRTTEVHVFSGASGYRDPILQVPTALHQTEDNYDFQLAYWTGHFRPDIMAIKKNKTDSRTTEVHILDAGSNYSRFALQTPTALHETPNNATFLVTDWMNTGRPDLVFIKKTRTESNATEVHILSGAHNYSFFVLHIATALPRTDDTWHFVFTHEFSQTHRPDLVAIKRVGQVIMEVCVLSGVNDFRTFLFHSGAHGQQSQRSSVLKRIAIPEPTWGSHRVYAPPPGEASLPPFPT